MDSVCPCLDHCLCTWITPLVKSSGYCSLIEDHARLLEYSSALHSIYLFAICSTLPVYLGMSINKSLRLDPHASRLIRPVTGSVLTSVVEEGQSQEDRPMAPLQGSGSQHQLLPAHHPMPNWLSYPLAAGPARQVFSMTGGLLDAVWCDVINLFP